MRTPTYLSTPRQKREGKRGTGDERGTGNSPKGDKKGQKRDRQKPKGGEREAGKIGGEGGQSTFRRQSKARPDWPVPCWWQSPVGASPVGGVAFGGSLLVPSPEKLILPICFTSVCLMSWRRWNKPRVGVRQLVDTNRTHATPVGRHALASGSGHPAFFPRGANRLPPLG